ncbi:MAG: acetyl-CoA carboxylase carboxyl transferase subunit beta [Armatimonadetes bacterium]|nr:acetyl-CoA carboxylase carboxyl transferase subunit beta [Armatimonadota bacterium]
MDAFLQCAGCKKILFSLEFEQALRVCPHCGHHHRLTTQQRIEATFDPGSFVETDAELTSGDPLGFPEYAEKLAIAVQKTGRNDSMVAGIAALGGHKVSVGVSDFSFMGGSMGSVNGEKVVRIFERAIENACPVIVFGASGGARMQEGLLSLMQMARTTAAVDQLREARLPFISVFTDPTMAGVLASYASIADVILSEPGALVGFAGARVSAQAQVQKVPDDFQKAEFCFRSGMVDRIVKRREMRSTLILLVQMLMGGRRAA